MLALGPPSLSGVGQSGGLAPYPVRLERELAKVLPGVDVVVEGRSLPGEITGQATSTIMNLATEVEPDLVVWQVGVNDVLARAEIARFSEALDEVLKWLRGHEVDAVLVEPPYTAAMATDDHFAELIAAIRTRARENEVPLVRRSAAMRILSEQKTEAAQTRFGLQSLGYHCTAEHVSHAVVLSATDASGAEASRVRP